MPKVEPRVVRQGFQVRWLQYRWLKYQEFYLATFCSPWKALTSAMALLVQLKSLVSQLYRMGYWQLNKGLWGGGAVYEALCDMQPISRSWHLPRSKNLLCEMCSSKFNMASHSCVDMRCMILCYTLALTAHSTVSVLLHSLTDDIDIYRERDYYINTWMSKYRSWSNSICQRRWDE